MTRKESKINFVEEFYNRGLHSVLEKILLVLPLATLLNCLKVNKRWEDIVRFYNNSNNSRICQILDEKKSLEWRKKKPRIFTLTFEEFNIFQINCLHIIADEREAILAACINQTKKARLFVIDTQTVHVLNILEVVDDAGDEIDVLNVKMNMNDDFLVAMVVSTFDNDKNKNLCYYFIWDRLDYSKKPFETKLFQYQKYLVWPIVSNNLLNIPVISDDGNLLIDETKKYTTQAEVTCEELNLMTKSRKTKVVTIQDFTPPAHVYRQNNVIFSEQREFPKKDTKDIIFLPYKTIAFRGKEKLLWQNNFEPTARIIGWSEHYIAVAASIPGTVTVFRLIDGKTVFKFEIGLEKTLQIGCSVREYWNFLCYTNSETTVQFSRNGIACKGMVLGNREKHPPFDLYILDSATGKVILECNQDLGLPDVKKFLLLEGSLVLEQGNKIVFLKFWL